MHIVCTDNSKLEFSTFEPGEAELISSDRIFGPRVRAASCRDCQPNNPSVKFPAPPDSHFIEQAKSFIYQRNDLISRKFLRRRIDYIAVVWTVRNTTQVEELRP